MKTITNLKITRTSNIIAFIALLTYNYLFANPYANKEPIKIGTTVTKVVVFRDRAQVTRTAPLTLSKGTYTLLLTNLPASLDPASLQVGGGEHLLISEVNIKNENRSVEGTPRYALLKEKLELLQIEERNLQIQIEILKEEREYLKQIKNKLTSPQEESTTKTDPSFWQQQIQFYKTSFEKNKKEELEISMKINDNKREIAAVQRELVNIGNSGGSSSIAIELPVLNNKDGLNTIVITYIVYGPSWKPLYDVRTLSAELSLTLRYQAEVVQNTGEDWSGIDLYLSTAMVEAGSTHGELTPWVLYEKPNYYATSSKKSGLRGNMKMAEAPAAAMAESFSEEEDNITLSKSKQRVDETPGAFEEASTESGLTSVLFSVPSKCDLPSTTEPKRFVLSETKMLPEITCSAIPKLSPRAYLKANLENRADYPLLPGEASIFMDNNFLTKSYLEEILPGDKKWFFLGADPGFEIERKLIKKLSSLKGFGDKVRKVTRFEYSISVKNLKKKAATIKISDQIPISQREDVVVTLISPRLDKESDVKLTKEKSLEWEKKLLPGEKVVLNLIYEVEAPSQLNLVGLD